MNLTLTVTQNSINPKVKSNKFHYEKKKETLKDKTKNIYNTAHIRH